MSMKDHILTALREQLNEWEQLLSGMSEAQLTTPLPSSEWSVKDELAHLRAWQQRTVARVDAALLKREPEFPDWPPELDPEADDVNQINAWINESARAQPWSVVYQNWRSNFQRLLNTAERISERDLLDSGQFAWLDGRPLVLILLATYDHHQEHLEKLRERVQKQ